MADKVVLVTGAQQGIGRACALAFAAAGYDAEQIAALEESGAIGGLSDASGSFLS